MYTHREKTHVLLAPMLILPSAHTPLPPPNTQSHLLSETAVRGFLTTLTEPTEEDNKAATAASSKSKGSSSKGGKGPSSSSSRTRGGGDGEKKEEGGPVGQVKYLPVGQRRLVQELVEAAAGGAGAKRGGAGRGGVSGGRGKRGDGGLEWGVRGIWSSEI